MIRSVLLSIAVFALLVIPSQVLAQNSADFTNGSVRIGNDTEACAAGKYGAVRYNTNKFQGCSTGGWVDIGTFGGGSAPPICTGSYKTLQYDGSAWACVTIAGGGSGDIQNPVWTTSAGSIGSATINTAFNATVTGTDNSGTVTFTKQSGSSWLTVNDVTGAISGTAPGAAGTGTIVVRLEDPSGNYLDRTFTVDVVDVTIVTISANATNVNLFTLAGSPSTAGSYEFRINTGVTVSATSTATAALETGAFPAGSTLTIVNNGMIAGKGGTGGSGGNGFVYPSAGEAGGNALSLGINVSIDNTNGNIWGGGGGGGGASFAIYGESEVAAGGIGGTGATGTTAATNGGTGGGYGAGDGGNGGANGSSGGNGSGMDYGGTSQDPKSGGAAGKAIALNGKTVTWLGGNDAARVKGLVN